MKRILTFNGDGRSPKRFQLLWTALNAGGSSEDAKARTPAVIRKEARLQDALESISEPVVQQDPNAPDRALTAEGGTLTLAQEDFELLQTYTEKTPWMPRVSRDVVDLWDFLSACPKEEK
jgi:hypothetical protein